MTIGLRFMDIQILILLTKTASKNAMKFVKMTVNLEVLQKILR